MYETLVVGHWTCAAFNQRHEPLAQLPHHFGDVRHFVLFK